HDVLPEMPPVAVGEHSRPAHAVLAGDLDDPGDLLLHHERAQRRRFLPLLAATGQTRRHEHERPGEPSRRAGRPRTVPPLSPALRHPAWITRTAGARRGTRGSPYELFVRPFGARGAHAGQRGRTT